MQVAFDSWAPEYGAPVDGDLEASAATVEPDAEVPSAQWAPLASREGAAAKRVRFVDGVRRVDAQGWITGEDGLTWQAVAASYAAGIACCEPASAQVDTCVVRHELISHSPDLQPLRTRHGRYDPFRSDHEQSSRDLVQVVQRRMRNLEAEVALRAGGADLLVVDGPLREATPIPGAVGYVKTHQRAYLEPALAAVVGRLAPGERTPLFLITSATGWARYSWYVRLPGGRGHPWAGVIRAEATGGLDPYEARQVADLVTATLPAYASSPAKDARAPQNLHPIAHLERRLRHHLGDPALRYRSLSLAAA